MIKRFISLNNISVFNNFSWSSSVLKDGNPVDLKKINIIFGRNYSGKTTLSRVVRALETKSLTAYENPEFKLTFEDGTTIDQNNYHTNNKTIRVFNEDFIKDNLAFISNPTEGIRSFAILGENATIEQRIQDLKTELGNCVEGNEFTGLYKIKQEAEKEYKKNEKILNDYKNETESLLKNKATGDKNNSIKYQSKYGDINYTVQKLKNELQQVMNSNEFTLSQEAVQQKETLLKENAKPKISQYTFPSTDFSKLQEKTQKLAEQRLVQASKIDELIKNALLGNWVKEGIERNRERKTCAFCGNEISESRWHELECHFDNASKQLEKDINSTINDISLKINEFEKITFLSKDIFYQQQYENFHSLEISFSDIKKAILDHLKELVAPLEKRKQDLFNPQVFTISDFFSQEAIKAFVANTNQLIGNTNEISKTLSTQQSEAQHSLRLNAVKEFSNTISYNNRLKTIEALSNNEQNAKNAFTTAENNVKAKEFEIKQLEAQLNDESLGAEKVNEYLNNFFGHKYLHLEAIKDSPEAISTKFEIQRNGKIAKNMSEGECRLVAFCYFMAKLEDNQTKGSSPIIWIDDPICSLDSNHIFFIYSLIKSEIVNKDSYSQLTISTHNLDFLKYLKRLKEEKINTRMEKRKTLYLIIEREENKSKIQLMPLYMEEYVSEFSYLFKQLYDCAQISTITSDNYSKFYNFGNNARKFLELYLFYKYPGTLDEKTRFKNFFDDSVTISMLFRLNNEYSHMCGVFERGERLIDVPEIKTVANAIIKKIQEKDPEQYNSLVAGIS